MKRVVTAVILIVAVLVGCIVWVPTAKRQVLSLTQLTEDAEKQYRQGNTEQALQTAERLSQEFKARTRHFDLFVSHQTLLEVEKNVVELPLVLRYGEEHEFVTEIRRCRLLLTRLWEQEIPKLDNIF